MEIHGLLSKVGITSNDLSEILNAIGNEKVSYNDLVARTGFSKETLKKFRDVFGLYLFPIPNFYVLNDKGKKLLENSSGMKRKFTQEDEELIRNIFKVHSSKRPVPKREYDQFYTTVETQVKRVKYFVENHDLTNSEVLFVGDDDITSICLLMLGVVKRVAVVDIDVSQLNFIEAIAKEEKLQVELYQCDLREKLPNELRGRFDIVFSDPPYTPDGFKLFLQREIEATKNESSTIYVCYGTSERAYERLLPVQKTICDFDLAINFASANFNKYTGAQSIGSSSNLYVLKPTAKTKLERKLKLKRIYTYE